MRLRKVHMACALLPRTLTLLLPRTSTPLPLAQPLPLPSPSPVPLALAQPLFLTPRLTLTLTTGRDPNPSPNLNPSPNPNPNPSPSPSPSPSPNPSSHPSPSPIASFRSKLAAQAAVEHLDGRFQAPPPTRPIGSLSCQAPPPSHPISFGFRLAGHALLLSASRCRPAHGLSSCNWRKSPTSGRVSRWRWGGVAVGW
jgi:hypothetical protein